MYTHSGGIGKVWELRLERRFHGVASAQEIPTRLGQCVCVIACRELVRIIA